MSQQMPGPDSMNPTRSPYDPEPDLGQHHDEIPWKPPVVAAVAGALAVAIFVIYAMVTGPGVDDVSSDEVSSPSSSAQPTDGLPPGYIPITSQVGARVESVSTVPSATFVFVSTEIRGSAEANAVRLPEVAYWELETSAGTFPMLDQFELAAPTGPNLGAFTVAFPPDVSRPGDSLRVYLVDADASESQTLGLSSDLPTEVTDFRIDMGAGAVIVVDSLQINRDGGYIEWRVEGGLTARLDVVVSFDGTNASGLSESTLVPEYAGDSFLDPSTAPDASSPYSFGSQYRLVPFGAPLDSGSPLTGLSVEFRVEAVTSVAEPVVLPFDGQGEG